MAIYCVYGRDRDEEIINDVLKLDQMAYPEYILGSYDSVSSRYRKNTDSYILAYNDNSKLVGYFCFFPVTDDAYEEILNSDYLVDDNLTYDDVEPWKLDGDNNVLIISIVILPEYREGKTICALSNAFAEFLSSKMESGISITSIVASAVSNDGVKVLNRWNFQEVKQLEEGYRLFACKGKKDINQLIEILKCEV